MTENGWLDGLPEELRALAAAKRWDGPAAALESYRQLERLMGADRAGRALVLPARDDDADGWRAVHARLGCPESPDGYALDMPDDMGTDDAVAEFRALAHDAGLSQAQAQRLTGWWRGRLDAALAAHAGARQTADRDAETALRARWGGDYDRRRADAARALARFARGLEGADGMAELEGLAGRPAALAMMADVGAALGEDGFAGGGHDGGFAMSADEARRELETLQRDKGFMAAFLDANHPDHARQVQRARRLNRLAAGLEPD
ncbi:MAG: hypothetical protein R3F55_00355 [Alphaproteobacteria bacterium]